jgi:hypothetical protein
MGSPIRRHKFDPFDLEIVDCVYAVACRHIEARDLYRDTAKSAKEQVQLRKTVFACADNGRLDFDTLCDQVLASGAEASSDRRAT